MRNVSDIKLVWSTIILLIAQAADIAVACECVGFQSIEDQLATADLVFSGRAVSTIKLDIPETRIVPDHETLFEVSEILKGERLSKVRIRHYKDGNACGISFVPGQRVEMFAGLNDDGVYYTSYCLLEPDTRGIKGWAWDDYRAVIERQK